MAAARKAYQLIPRKVRLALRENRPETPEERELLEACSVARGADGFITFLQRAVWIQDRKTKRNVPFDPFEGQRRIIPNLVAGLWLVLLKGRQLGITWLVAAYALWRICYEPMYTVTVINQSKEYAEDFIWRVKYMYDRLPECLQKRITREHQSLVRWEANGNHGEVRAVAGSAKAGRSMSGDLVVMDEASRIDYLDVTMQALQPQIDVGEGQIVMLSSSAGPQGIFYETWQENYGDHGEKLTETGMGESGFMPMFIHWSERPGRDAAWYENEKKRLGKVSPVAIKQEYPDNPQEAWEYATGRVYPLFTRKHHVGDIDIPTTALRYRAIDWGQSKSAQVCLWIAHVPGNPGLLISPKCPNTIREMFAYRWDKDDESKILKEDDHAADALRYAVVTFGLTGLVYVYREMYETDSVEHGWNPMNEIVAVHEMSGWERDEDYQSLDLRDGSTWKVSRRGELYEGTVADRSWPKMIELWNLHDLEVIPHKTIRGKKGDDKGGELTDNAPRETLEGIRLVSALIEGSERLEPFVQVTRDEIAEQVERSYATLAGKKVATSLRERAVRLAAKRVRQLRNTPR